MIEFLHWLMTISAMLGVGIGGLLICAAVIWFLPELRLPAIVAACGVVAAVSAFGYGMHVGRAELQAKLDREIAAAVAKGQDSKAEALKKFDANKEIEDDEFMRKD